MRQNFFVEKLPHLMLNTALRTILTQIVSIFFQIHHGCSIHHRRPLSFFFGKKILKIKRIECERSAASFSKSIKRCMNVKQLWHIRHTRIIFHVQQVAYAFNVVYIFMHHVSNIFSCIFSHSNENLFILKLYLYNWKWFVHSV